MILLTKDERFIFCAAKRLPRIEHKLVKAAKSLALLHQELQETEHAQKAAAMLSNRNDLYALIKREKTSMSAITMANELKATSQRKLYTKLKYALKDAQQEVRIARDNFNSSTREVLKDVPAMVGVFVLPDAELSDIWQKKLDKLHALQDEYLECVARMEILNSDFFAYSYQFFLDARKKRLSIAAIQQEAQVRYGQALARYNYALRGFGYFRKNVEKLRTVHRAFCEQEIIFDELHKADLTQLLLDHSDEYPGIETWIQQIRYNSVLRPSPRYGTLQIYYGGEKYPDDYNHGHISTPIRKDGTLNPAAKPYFCPPNQRGRARPHG